MPVTDNEDGSATIHALAGNQSVTIMCLVTKTIGTANVIGVGLTLVTPAPIATKLIPSVTSLHYTARGQAQAVTMITEDQYGIVDP